MTIQTAAFVILSVFGALFFLAGSLGILRFGDVLTRLHAVTKADNVGLALLLSGVAVQSGNLEVALKLGLVWILLVISSETSSNLIAQKAVAERESGSPSP